MNQPDSDPPDPDPADSFELSLEDTLAQKMRGLPVKSRVAVAGYNPYNAEPAVKSPDKDKKDTSETRKPTDLRKLSEWIRLNREVAELKKQKS